ncbi:hypothetical protein VIGAN_04288800, partial [Vigna angularis var. angularis]
IITKIEKEISRSKKSWLSLSMAKFDLGFRRLAIGCFLWWKDVFAPFYALVEEETKENRDCETSGEGCNIQT